MFIYSDVGITHYIHPDEYIPKSFVTTVLIILAAGQSAIKCKAVQHAPEMSSLQLRQAG